MEGGTAGVVFGGQRIPERAAGANVRAGWGKSLWGGTAGIGGGEGGTDRVAGNEATTVDGKRYTGTAQGGCGEGEDRIAVEAGKYYDVEMDRAAVADGELDQCGQLPGEQGEMSRQLSIVWTDPFTFISYIVGGKETGKADMTISRTDPFTMHMLTRRMLAGLA